MKLHIWPRSAAQLTFTCSGRCSCEKFTTSEASLRRLAEIQVARHFVQRAFEDAKGACGMADYQVRGWQAWHHHIALVMIALMFLAKERLANRDTADLLSCNDLVEIMLHKLLTKIETEPISLRQLKIADDDVNSPKISPTKKQASTQSVSDRNEI